MPAKRHQLYEIDLDRRRAFCTICGYTDIVISKTIVRSKPKIVCVARAEIRRKYAREWSARLRPSTRKPRHVLTKIDPVAMRAVCSVCGPTDIWRGSSRGEVHYTCGTKYREYMREYMREYYRKRKGTKKPSG